GQRSEAPPGGRAVDGAAPGRDAPEARLLQDRNAPRFRLRGFRRLLLEDDRGAADVDAVARFEEVGVDLHAVDLGADPGLEVHELEATVRGRLDLAVERLGDGIVQLDRVRLCASDG